MAFTEPMTMLTDYVLAILTGLLAVSLFRVGHARGQTSVRLWAGAFLAIAATALVGGTYHGSGHILSERILEGLWKMTMYISGFISFFMLMAAVVACLSRRWHSWILGVTIIKLLLYLVWVSTHDEFRFVIYDYGSAMFLVLCLYGIALFRFSQRGSLWVIAGLLLSVVAAALQRSGIDLSPHFNHNDLYHVVQMAAIYLLYKGVLKSPWDSSKETWSKPMGECS